MKTLVIGDPHYKDGKELENREFSHRIIDVVKKYSPEFVVLLGDILDKHAVANEQPFNNVYHLLNELVDILPVYILMGNHDLRNNKQFLTDNHFFNPYKKWSNLYIIDKPLCVEIKDKTFIFVPYVPPGKFIEALNTLPFEDVTWETVDCIFAHQEFHGSAYGPIPEVGSNIGDVWDDDYPLVISGHIHTSGKLGTNIFYPGIPIQHTYSDSDDKRVWVIEWDKESSIHEGFPKMIKVNLGIKSKKFLKHTVEEMEYLHKDKAFLQQLSKCDTKIELTGTSAEFNHFRKSEIYTMLSSPPYSAIFSKQLYNSNIEESLESLSGSENAKTIKENLSYDKVFYNLVSQKDILIQKEYEYIFGIKVIGNVELNFINSSEDS